MSEKMFGGLVKAVVDIEKDIMAVDADFHANEEFVLLEQGSQQEHLWGINIHPENDMENWIEFDSMINARPSQGNRTCGVDDPKIRERIVNIVKKTGKTIMIHKSLESGRWFKFSVGWPMSDVIFSAQFNGKSVAMPNTAKKHLSGHWSSWTGLLQIHKTGVGGLKRFCA